MTDLAALRFEYSQGGLPDTELRADPLDLFRRWFAEAQGVNEPNAMVVATVGADGQPSSRTVLLKGLDERGFVFYTNQQSRKGVELATEPRCALLFPWFALERQVRVEGTATTLPRDEVERYFHSRPRGAQIGAWASRQSQPVASREALDAAYAEADARFPGVVPLPDAWGGYVVAPTAFEFWQGRSNRLHDRLRFELTAAGGWRGERLAP